DRVGHDRKTRERVWRIPGERSRMSTSRRTRAGRSGPGGGSRLSSSHSRRIRLRQLAALPGRRTLERLERPRFVEMHERIELAGETRVEVVTHALGRGPMDNADG